jgi:Dolichyl-phosphate-mannose-protein mannosyltransferase
MYPSLHVTRMRPGAQALVGFCVLAAPLCVAGFVLGSGALFGRPLWLDERQTFLVANQHSLHDVVRALIQGADSNPPLLFVWHWLIGRLHGGVTAWQLRATAFLSMLAAVIGFFLLLRRAFGALPALAGAFVVAANAQIVRYAFDARFYGPWMLLVVVHLWLLVRFTAQRRHAAEQALLCLSAAALCLIHYFGIITLLLIDGAVLLAVAPDKRCMRAIWPSAATGALTVLALLPMLKGQRAALSVATWVPPASILLAIQFLGPYLLLYVAAAATRRTLRQGLRRGDGPADRHVVVAGLLSLALLPLILTGFSFFVQSVMMIRYALPAFLATGLVASALFAQLGSRLRVAFGVVFVVAGLSAAATQAAETRSFQLRVRADSATAETELRRGRVIAAPVLHTLYPLWDTMNRHADAMVMATVPATVVRERFPDSSDSAGFGNFILVQQDVARVSSRLFGVPHQVSADSLARLRCFVLIEQGDEPDFVRRWMPAAMVTRLREHVFLVSGQPRNGDATDNCPDARR